MPQGYTPGQMFERRAQAFWAKVDKAGPVPDPAVYGDIGPCWVWTGRTNMFGYGIRSFNDHLSGRAHRASWMLENGPIPDGLKVLHNCDNKICVRPGHLRLGTHQDNGKDKKDRGRARSARGEANPHSKLTQDQVVTIRARYKAGGVSQPQLGREYGLAQSSVWAILNRVTWGHLP